MIVTPEWRDRGSPDAQVVRQRHDEFNRLLHIYRSRGYSPGRAWYEARQTQAFLEASRKAVITFVDKVAPALQRIANQLNLLFPK